MNRKEQRLDNARLKKILLIELIVLVLLLLITGCQNINNNGIPCEVIRCTDNSCINDAWNNGVLNEICNKGCEL